MGAEGGSCEVSGVGVGGGGVHLPQRAAVAGHLGQFAHRLGVGFLHGCPGDTTHDRRHHVTRILYMHHISRLLRSSAVQSFIIQYFNKFNRSQNKNITFCTFYLPLVGGSTGLRE